MYVLVVWILIKSQLVYLSCIGQSYALPFMQELKNVLRIIDVENVIHIVTYNGSNFKKACKLLSREPYASTA
jgi:hypothetical protein